MQTILLVWLLGMLNINGRSHVMGHMIILQIFGALKSCAFGEIIKRYSIDSTSWVGLSWG